MKMSAAESGRFGAAFEWLGVERAWTRTRGSPDVLIAIVDEGVQLDHPLLGPNIHRERMPQATSVDSYEIPGTHAAGVAAGRHSDAEQFSGVAPCASILPVRFSSRPGSQALDLAHAIEYAVEAGACIINISHAADLALAAVQRAIQYAATRNALVVCSARESGSPPHSSADPPNLLRVLAVDEEARPLANYAGGAAHLAAPGFARVPQWRSDGHTSLVGPAMGAPYVSGCAALVKSLNPSWGYLELREHLLVCGTPQPQLGEHCQTGQVLNVANAVLGPLELAEDMKSQTWSALSGATVHWRLRYRSALCVNAVALFRSHGDEHWRELAFARAASLKMDIPAASLRRSSGTLRISCREANFHADDMEVTIR